MKSSWDLPALRAGASVALAFGVPFSIAGTLVNNHDPNSSLAPWLALAAVFGFVLGGGVAAWTQRRGMPLAHGIVCAVGTYVVAQAVFIIVKLARGSDVRWMAAAFNLTAVIFAGMIGGLLGSALQKRGVYPSSLRSEMTDRADGDGAPTGASGASRQGRRHDGSWDEEDR